MRAYQRVSGQLEIQPRVPAPLAGVGEVVVKVAYWGVLPSSSQDSASTLTVVGKIIAVGEEVPAFRLGDQICAACKGTPDITMALGAGELGEYQRVLVDETVTLKGEIVVPFAALLPTYYARAELLLHWGEVARDEAVLVMGADQKLGPAVAHLSGLRSTRVEVDVLPSSEIWHHLVGSSEVKVITGSSSTYDVILDCRPAGAYHELLPKLKPHGVYLREDGLLVHRDGNVSSPDHRRDNRTTSELEQVVALFEAGKLASTSFPLTSFEDGDRVRSVLAADLKEPIVIAVPV